ncbi:CAP domain-containing protein [Gongronella butleri]|nr:CAP domain-containing protein [Gongronella butleri]
MAAVGVVAGDVVLATAPFPFNKTEIADMVKTQNRLRRLHGVPDLKWNHTIADFEANWALKMSKNNTLSHSPGRAWGEDALGWGGGGKMEDWILKRSVNGSGYIEAWYSEINRYNWKDPTDLQALHFTALIWKSATSFGCGAAYSQTGNDSVAMKFYCGFAPWDNNMVGDFYKNVLPPKSGNFSQYGPLYKACLAEKGVNSDKTFKACAQQHLNLVSSAPQDGASTSTQKESHSNCCTCCKDKKKTTHRHHRHH